MTARMIAGLGAALFAVTATAALAQESTNRVAANTDWSVFVEENPKTCWGVSAPKETVNTRDGQPVSVRRGDILLFVTFRPGQTEGEVSFAGGYPFAPGSTVELVIGEATFNLGPGTDAGNGETEWAWSSSAEDDARIVTALKGGTSAVLSARSGKGTQTKDTFSLLGVSAALDEAAKRCAG
jgi:hypothetical protein